MLSSAKEAHLRTSSPGATNSNAALLSWEITHPKDYYQPRVLILEVWMGSDVPALSWAAPP